MLSEIKFFEAFASPRTPAVSFGDTSTYVILRNSLINCLRGHIVKISRTGVQH